MAEILGLLVTGVHTARAPSANAYKLLFTATQGSSVGLLVANTAATAAKFRIAVIENGYSYADGDVPATYQFIAYDVDIDPGSPPIPINFQISAGDRIAVRTDTAGVTFLPSGIQV